MRETNARGEQPRLWEEDLAFYDALETNDSAVQVLGDKTLRDIARELLETVRGNVTIDWTLRENVRATFASWCGGSCADTGTRRTSRRRRR